MAVSINWTRTTTATAAETTAMTFAIADNGTNGAVVHCTADPGSTGTPKLLYRIYINTAISNQKLTPTISVVSFDAAPNYVSASNPADSTGLASEARNYQTIDLPTWHTAAGD